MKSSSRPGIWCFILRLVCICTPVHPRQACGVFFLAPEHGTGCPRPQPDFDLEARFRPVVERLGRDDPETVKLTGILSQPYPLLGRSMNTSQRGPEMLYYYVDWPAGSTSLAERMPTRKWFRIEHQTSSQLAFCARDPVLLSFGHFHGSTHRRRQRTRTIGAARCRRVR